MAYGAGAVLLNRQPVGSWVKIHQALLSQFSLLVEFFIGKLRIEDEDSGVLMLLSLDPGL